MKRFGIQWDSTRINGRNYVHVGLYVDSPDKKRTAARVAAFKAGALQTIRDERAKQRRAK